MCACETLTTCDLRVSSVNARALDSRKNPQNICWSNAFECFHCVWHTTHSTHTQTHTSHTGWHCAAESCQLQLMYDPCSNLINRRGGATWGDMSSRTTRSGISVCEIAWTNLAESVIDFECYCFANGVLVCLLLGIAHNSALLMGLDFYVWRICRHKTIIVHLYRVSHLKNIMTNKFREFFYQVFFP